MREFYFPKWLFGAHSIQILAKFVYSIQERMYKVKQFGSGSEPAGCLSKQQLSNQARFKAATAKKNSPSRSFNNFFREIDT